MRNINRMTSGSLAFTNQAAAQDIVQAEKLAASLDNIANAFIQKNDTIDKLVATNQQQAKIIADLTEAKWAGRKNPPHWRSTKPKLDTTGYCWTHGFLG
jgi:hypothetical protein